MTARTATRTATRGVLYVHSSPSALCPHIEWAVGGVLGVAVSLDWTPQPAQPGTYRVRFSAPDAYVGEWWNDKPTRELADDITGARGGNPWVGVLGARYLLRGAQALGFAAGRGASFLDGHARSRAWPEFLATLEREWDGLVAHRDYPMISLDNNPAERMIRGPVVTRKNAGGSRNEDSARLSAWYSEDWPI